jgi:hypothetical protein
MITSLIHVSLIMRLLKYRVDPHPKFKRKIKHPKIIQVSDLRMPRNNHWDRRNQTTDIIVQVARVSTRSSLNHSITLRAREPVPQTLDQPLSPTQMTPSSRPMASNRSLSSLTRPAFQALDSISTPLNCLLAALLSSREPV